MGWFGVDAPEVYDKKQFTNQFLDKGELYWNFRLVLFDFFYALECGYINNYMPSPDCCIDKETVETCLEKLSYEWEKERKTRGEGNFNNSLDFNNILTPNQKLALVEQLLHIYPPFADNAKKWKAQRKNMPYNQVEYIPIDDC